MLLFECLSEEIPPRMQNLAVIQVQNYIINAFSKNDIKFASAEVFITARRITLFVDSIYTNDTIHAHSETKTPLNIKLFLKNQLEEMMRNFPWPKSMRWGRKRERWIRPIKSILCIFNDEIIPISFADITASNVTFGHRFFTKDQVLTIKTPTDYFEVLAQNNVLLQHTKRKQFILDQVQEFIQVHKLQLEKNNHLLDYINGLVEWPIMLFGKVNQEKSMDLPKEVILSIIHTQQRYLALSDGQKILYFATVVNVKNNNVIIGHEKIIEARLADAQFLISQDKQHSLDDYASKLDSISFHTYLGNMKEKVERITALSKYVAIWVPNASLIHVERTAYLAKADLATSMVKEFPELQGVVGRCYATYCQEVEEVAESIAEHYKPIRADQECPRLPSGIAVSIADKIDSIIGLIIAGEKISGSYDQLGLRRMSLGVIRTILENSLHVPLSLLISKSLSLYPRRVFAKPTDKLEKKQQILKFFLDRFKVMLKNMNIKQALIDSIFYKDDSSDLLRIKEQVIMLHNYLNKQSGKQAFSTYKRISNIVKKIQEEECSVVYKKKLLIDNEEITLSKHSRAFYKSIKRAMTSRHFNIALDELTDFIPVVNLFMDNVRINCDSAELKKNRLSLLLYVMSIFHLIADFSHIQ